MRRRMRHRARGALRGPARAGAPGYPASLVVLTTAHRDHVPEHCEEANLFAACQKCHLAYDSGHHAMTRARTRQARATAGMEPLPGPWPEAAGTGGTAEPDSPEPPAVPSVNCPAAEADSHQANERTPS